MTQDVDALIIDGVSCESLQGGVQLNLRCPVCGYNWSQTVSLGSGFSLPFDFNQLVSFTVPQHVCVDSGGIVNLFIAVHSDSNGIVVCVQRSDAEGAVGISTDWWVHSQ